MDNEGPRTTPPDANTSPATSPSNATSASPPDDAITDTTHPVKASPPRPNPWHRPLELVALAAWIVLLIALLVIKPENRRMRGYRNSANHATLCALTRALEAYAADYGTYPARAHPPLVDDTTFFVQCLRAKSPRGQPYFAFRDDEIVHGEYRSSFGKPVHYTFPVSGIRGPDGVMHDKVDYYLWTWGWEGFVSQDSKETPSEWGVNNWSR